MQFTRRVKERGSSCIFISHRLRAILEYADDVVVMRDGGVTDRVVMGPRVSAAVSGRRRYRSVGRDSGSGDYLGIA